ncbi:LysR substrate-binding domain-containing protein [Amantichitinum ursilacus]|uniref:HTH-type transcriptional regulator BenM n=1 Tax=Amantichitinum ursilacus TaxID=857265 RepID=A0A0N0XHL9_9NEIS|nr:LysR substrate-binding domain-containing protein [Amantichitinum ursilacus]KPC52006.1 HTH-type transcriptional regulator BenM [Amantichitinum ursilacus]
MDLRHLRYFLAVAEEGHFGRAAARLHIVQPALSMQIKALEDELGGPLFIRTSRRVELTEAGLLLQAEARRTLEQVEHTRQTIARSLRGETGRVRVGFAGNAIFSGKLTRHLRQFHQRYPDADLVIEEVGPLQQAAAILAGQIDVGYTPDNPTTSAPGIKAQRIGDWTLLVALAEDHPLAAHADLTLDQLAGQALILYDAHDAHEPLYELLSHRLGNGFSVARRSSSTLSVLAHAAAGLGVALVPAPLQQVRIPGLTYRALKAPELMANLVLISRLEEPGHAVQAYLALALGSE